jgi:hypothetical protein
MLERMRRLIRTEGGQGAIGLVVVVVAVVVSFYLLLRTVNVADSINTKASTIQTGANSIKGDTSVIEQLTHTNAIATSILNTAAGTASDGSQSLVSKLNTIIATAKSIDGFAVTINGTAGAINNTAHSIQGTAASILGTATTIQGDAATIKGGLDTAVSLAGGILGDAAAVRVEATSIRTSTCAIDKAVGLGCSD